MAEDRMEAFRKGIREALLSSHEILSKGGSSVDAVEVAVKILEDLEVANAGRGAVFAADGKHYLDASIMDGRPEKDNPTGTKRAGAVGAVQSVKNPISFARKIMDKSDHVFLVAEEAERYAQENDIPLLDNAYFSTDYRRKQFLKVAESGGTALDHSDQDTKRSTVGAVACDQDGHVAAATSTGGTTNKHPARVGDSAVIGAGTYAEDNVCAVSCTGWGDVFIKYSVANTIANLIKLAGRSFSEAVREIVEELLPEDSGGLIAVNSKAEIRTPFNTRAMARGQISSDGEPIVQILRDS